MGPLAQSVEQRTFNPWVVGSIPTGPTSENLLSCKALAKLSAKTSYSRILVGNHEFGLDLTTDQGVFGKVCSNRGIGHRFRNLCKMVKSIRYD